MDGFVGRNSGTSEDAGGGEIDLPFVESDGGLEGAVSISINLDLGAGFDGLYKQGDPLEHGRGEGGGENEIFTNRQDEIGAPVNCGAHLGGVGEDGAGGSGPGGTGDDDSIRGTDAVATVEENGRGVAGDGDQVAEGEYGSGAESVRVGGKAGGDAVGIVAVTPDTGRGLGGVVEIDFVAVFPVIVSDAGGQGCRP